MKKKIFSVLLCTTMLMCSAVGCESDKSNRNSTQSISSSDINLNDIETIKIDTSGYLSPTCECEINFTNNSLVYKTTDYDEIETFYAEFTDKDAEYFIKKANFYGFFNWEKSYENNNVYDGYGTTICIKFTDGSVQETHCYADFPTNYDKMAEVFHEAFEYNIL